jgi:hypothetical protein
MHVWVVLDYGPLGDASGSRTKWYCHRCETSVTSWQEPYHDTKVMIQPSGDFLSCEEVMAMKVMES